MISAAITEALERIRALEERPDFTGPKISEEIEAIQAIAADFDEQQFDDDEGNMLLFPRQWVEDVVVGAVGRAVKSHWNTANHLDDWMIDIEDGGAGGLFAVYIKDRLGHKIAVGQGPLALAALLAWEEAISPEKE